MFWSYLDYVTAVRCFFTEKQIGGELKEFLIVGIHIQGMADLGSKWLACRIKLRVIRGSVVGM